MSTKYLNNSGLNYLASKIKAKLAGKAATDLSNVDDSVFASKAATAGAGGTPRVAATSTDGVTYTATVPGMTALEAGKSIIITPNTVSTAAAVKLNVNGLGDKYIRLRTGYNTSTTTNGAVASWLAANKPIEVMYDGTYWIADLQRTSANAISGTIPVANGGTGVTSLDELKSSMGAASAETITVSVGTSWTEDTTNGGYYQTCTATGMVAGDNPVVDVILGSDVAANDLYKEAWACVDRVVTADDSVTVYANETAPTTAFTFQAKVVR